MFIRRSLVSLAVISSLALGEIGSMRDQIDGGTSMSIDELIESLNMENRQRNLNRSYINSNKSSMEVLLGKWSVEYKIKNYYTDVFEIDRVYYNSDLGYVATGKVKTAYLLCSYYKAFEDMGGYMCLTSIGNIVSVYNFDLDKDKMTNAYYGIGYGSEDAMNMALSKSTPINGYKITSSSSSFSSSSAGFSSSSSSTCTYSANDIESAKESQKESCRVDPASCGIVIDNQTVEQNTTNSAAKISREFIDGLGSGWSLIGTGEDVVDMGIFNSAKKIFSYKNSIWKKYEVEDTTDDSEPPVVPTFSIEKFDGFWIHK